MTEEEKMMLRRLIVKEDELEELQLEIGMVLNLAGEGKEFKLASLGAKMESLSREIEILKDKLREVCGE